MIKAIAVTKLINAVFLKSNPKKAMVLVSEESAVKYIGNIVEEITRG
jgi:hypothetical protein